MITVDERTASWIRTHVLPAHYDNSYEPLIKMCACQWGRCGHCDAGNHDQCARRRAEMRDWKPFSPEAYVITRNGWARTPVWRANGPACRWLCPCTTCARRAAIKPPQHQQQPASSTPQDQLSLF
jgi:hypothetical protein